MLKITCYGEVLWDVFPTHKKVGGAPLNVALRLQSLKNDVAIVSSVGDDEKGEKLLQFIQKNGVNTAFVQIDKEFPTGEVTVMLSQKGSASYEIKFPSAWDKIRFNEAMESRIKISDAFVYGSIVSRNDISRETLFELLKYARYKIFDVNLRKPHYTKEVLLPLMNQADFIKFNDDEIFEISRLLGSKYNSLEQNIYFISKETNTESICVTKGRHGAVLFFEKNLYYNSGYQIKVVDTVGAGDSFLASLVSQLLQNRSPQYAIDFSCAVGALVAQREGANPIISLTEINKFIHPYS